MEASISQRLSLKRLINLTVVGSQLLVFLVGLGLFLPSTYAQSLADEAALAQQEADQINAALYARANKQLKFISKKNNPVSIPLMPLPKTAAAINLWAVITADFSLGNNSDRAEVRHEILWFLSRRGILNEMLQNAVPYLYYVYQQTQQRHMPAEFALLPLVESGYDPFAYSQAGATGLWQMMPGTASSFGLDISWWYDSRRDTIISTQAALNFLCSLHDMVHNWLLAAAAYDVGVGAVQAAQQYNMRSDRDTSFWNLPLPQETRTYVPRLLALAEIVKNPQYYGVKLPYIPAHPYFATINMNSQIDLAEVSHFATVPVDVIHRLNPAMLRWATNPNGVYALLVPYDKKAIFIRNLQAVAGKEHVSWQYHEIRHGDTLKTIAKNYHTNMDLLQQVNALTDDRLTPNQGLLVPLHLHRTYGGPMLSENSNSGILMPPKTKAISAAQITNQSVVDQNDESLKQLLGKIYNH